MASTIRVYKLTWMDAIGLIGLLRASTVIAGSIARVEVIDKILAIEKAFSDDLKASMKDPSFVEKYIVSLELNRDHVGSIKLSFIELWSGRDTSGARCSIIAALSRTFSIWTSHILPNLPKDSPDVAITFDDEASDLLVGDEANEVSA